MLERVDAWLLALAEKVVKKLNWWTGKDNFSFAWFVNTLVRTSTLITVAAMSLLFVAGFIAIFALWGFFLMRILIRSAEVMKTSEQMRGVKLTELESRLATLRAIHFLELLISFVLAAYAVSSGVPWGIFALPCMAVFNLLIVYLVSVDRPPFAKSRAWESLKEFFTVRELVPVPVRVRPQ